MFSVLDVQQEWRDPKGRILPGLQRGRRHPLPLPWLQRQSVLGVRPRHQAVAARKQRKVSGDQRVEEQAVDGVLRRRFRSPTLAAGKLRRQQVGVIATSKDRNQPVVNEILSR